jgi:putative ribosome biogenesis GTPase RsgA
MMIVGNKIDLVAERKVADSDGAALANELGAEFLTTSAKDGTNIQKLFEVAPTAVLKHKEQENSKI